MKVLEELQTAIDGGEEPLGEESERYNFANIVSRARESFQDEDVYYKLVTTDDYVALAITTKRRQMFILTDILRLKEQLAI